MMDPRVRRNAQPPKSRTSHIREMACAGRKRRGLPESQQANSRTALGALLLAGLGRDVQRSPRACRPRLQSHDATTDLFQGAIDREWHPARVEETHFIEPGVRQPPQQVSKSPSQLAA